MGVIAERLRRAALAAMPGFLVVLLPMPALPASAPSFAPGEEVLIAGIGAGGTATLADGRGLVLADLAVPRGREPEAAAAKSALERLLLGRQVELRYGGGRQDRHGRVVAQLFVAGRWVQGEMLRRGLARVEGTPDNRDGLAAMLALERAARRARRGLWRDPFYAVRRAEEAGRYAGSFQLVAGRVAAAHPASGALFLDFADDWRDGLSLHLDADALQRFRAAGKDPALLAGRRLRVRGFIQGGARPVIDVTYPEQIEILR